MASGSLPHSEGTRPALHRHARPSTPSTGVETQPPPATQRSVVQASPSSHAGGDTALIAESASSRPAPETGSKPGAPMSTAVSTSVWRTCAGVLHAFFWRRSAATAAESGAEADVPKNGLYPETFVVTPSRATRSGL